MILLIILEADVTAFLIALSFQNIVDQNTFALFLAIELVGFSLTSYIYRAEKNRDLPSRGWIAIGSCVIMGLFFSSLFFT